MISVYNIHHSPAVWEDPEAFEPERFGPLDGSVPNEQNTDYRYGCAPLHGGVCWVCCCFPLIFVEGFPSSSSVAITEFISIPCNTHSHNPMQVHSIFWGSAQVCG